MIISIIIKQKIFSICQDSYILGFVLSDLCNIFKVGIQALVQLLLLLSISPIMFSRSHFEEYTGGWYELFRQQFYVIRLLSSDSSQPPSSNSECLSICYVISLKMHASTEMEVPVHMYAPPSNCNEYCREFKFVYQIMTRVVCFNLLFSVFFQINLVNIYYSEEYASDLYTSLSLSASY